MIQLNKTYQINNGQGTIIFTEGKQSTVNATYSIKNKKDSGIINGSMDGNKLKGTFHNKIQNSIGLIEFVFNDIGFDCRWKQGIEPGPMRGKWQGLLEIGEKNQTDTQNALPEVGIYSANYDEDDDEWIMCYEAEEAPYVIAIGFFAQHVQKTEKEWYGFVGYVVTNTCDKFRTESVLFIDEAGQMLNAHDMGGEAITEDGLDLVEAFKSRYPAEWSKIMALYEEYFHCTEEQQEEDSLYLSIKKDIPPSLQLERIYTGEWLDLEIVKKSNGFRLGTMLELNTYQD